MREPSLNFENNAEHILLHLLSSFERRWALKLREAGGNILIQNATRAAMDNTVPYAEAVASMEELAEDEMITVVQHAESVSHRAEIDSATKNTLTCEVILPTDSPLMTEMDNLLSDLEMSLGEAIRSCPHPIMVYTKYPIGTITYEGITITICRIDIR